MFPPPLRRRRRTWWHHTGTQDSSRFAIFYQLQHKRVMEPVLTFDVKPPRSGVRRMCFNVLTKRGSDYVSAHMLQFPLLIEVHIFQNVPVAWRRPRAWRALTSPGCGFPRNSGQRFAVRDSMLCAWFPRTDHRALQSTRCGLGMEETSCLRGGDLYDNMILVK